MRLVLDVECSVDGDVPQPEFLSVLRSLHRIVTGQFELVGDDYASGIEIMDYDEARVIGRIALQPS